MTKFKRIALACAMAAATAVATPAFAGPYILGGDDADDHGYADATGNRDGWFYNQRALEALVGSNQYTATSKVIYAFGVDEGTQASGAITSSIAFSTTALHDFTVDYLNDDEIDAFFANGSFTGANGGLLYIPTGEFAGVGGGMSLNEEARLTTYATQINSFLGSGNALLSHTNGYDWLATLVPGLATADPDGSAQGLVLTAAGAAAFPGLTDADLSTGPYHNVFLNTGGVPVLANQADGSGNPVILFSAGGTITDPTTGVPEPASWAMMIGGIGGMGTMLRRRRADANARIATA